MRDEFICYLPRTFIYHNVQGESAGGENESDDNDYGNDTNDEKATYRIVQRIKLFTADMTEDDVNKVVAVDEVSPVNDNDGETIPPSDNAASSTNMA